MATEPRIPPDAPYPDAGEGKPAYGVDPNREYRAVYALLEWRQLPWWKRLWEWLVTA